MSKHQRLTPSPYTDNLIVPLPECVKLRAVGGGGAPFLAVGEYHRDGVTEVGREVVRGEPRVVAQVHRLVGDGPRVADHNLLK